MQCGETYILTIKNGCLHHCMCLHQICVGLCGKFQKIWIWHVYTMSRFVTHLLLMKRTLFFNEKSNLTHPLCDIDLSWQSKEPCHFVMLSGEPIKEPVVQHGKSISALNTFINFNNLQVHCQIDFTFFKILFIFVKCEAFFFCKQSFHLFLVLNITKDL